MAKYKGRYKTTSMRKQDWDYGWNATYFVTICTHNRICYFGEVVEGQMILSAIGKEAEKCWLAIPDHFPFVKLHSHVVMPNHVHGIIMIDKVDDRRDRTTVETQDFASPQASSSSSQPVSGDPSSLPSSPSPSSNKFGPQSRNLASIIRGFKIGVTKYARTIDPDFAWQTRYHDHIIRDMRAYENISRYIINNPVNWKEDSLHNRK